MKVDWSVVTIQERCRQKWNYRMDGGVEENGDVFLQVQGERGLGVSGEHAGPLRADNGSALSS